MFNYTCELVKEEEQVNDYGTAVMVETSRRTVFCDVSSISMKEAYEALGVGHKPEVRVRIADYLDYQGERKVVLNGAEYNVIRTYQTGNGAIELTLERL